MRTDHHPLWLKRALTAYDRAWAKRFLCPQFDAVGEGLIVFGPEHVEVNGPRVRVGRDVHMMATRDSPIRLTVFAQPGGHIDIGDYSIVLPGARISSATRITIGKNCMFATKSYVTDADWHDLYDRTSAPGSTAPVVLEDNVWIGDSAIVCKGVTIGENSVIGAGSVVTRDIPPNTVAAGNPARVIKPLDPERELIRRESLFDKDVSYAEWIDKLETWLLTPNTLRSYLRARFAPTRDS